MVWLNLVSHILNFLSLTTLTMCDYLHHNDLQFSVFDNEVKGFHMVDAWGHSLVFLNYKITSNYIIQNCSELNSNFRSCRHSCSVSKMCPGVTWLPSTKVCLKGNDESWIGSLKLAPSTGAMTQVKTKFNSPFFPALDGWFYKRIGRNIFANCTIACNPFTFAYPQDNFQLENMVQFSVQTKKNMRINLVGNFNDKQLSWNELSASTNENELKPQVGVNWNSNIPVSSFMINKNGVIGAVSDEAELNCMCMADLLYLHKD